MAKRIDTDEILDAAVRVIGRTGLQKLAMVDVALEAGISRHTLSRRFPTQAAMLEALGDFTVRRFDRNIRAAIALQPAPEARVGLVVEVSFDLIRDESLGRLLELEPRYFRSFLRRHYAACRRTTSAMLVWPQALPEGEAGQALAEAGEVILRYGLSLEVAEPADWSREVELVTRLVTNMLGAQPPVAVRREPAKRDRGLARLRA